MIVAMKTVGMCGVTVGVLYVLGVKHQRKIKNE